MARPKPQSDDDRIETGVYHDGTEVAVRSRSQHSRDVHIPDTDGGGDVIFVDGDGDRVDEAHDDARPRPECDVEANSETEWVLRPIRSVENRGTCRRCFDPDEVADQNSANGASVTFARKMRYGSDWGTEEQSGNTSQGSGD